ncbi:MAG: tetratricopeptide repeat protein [Acidobacteria bacterium]|nr:tetratricopeptide repeat protein [Acidobacteriota bacterium]
MHNFSSRKRILTAACCALLAGGAVRAQALSVAVAAWEQGRYAEAQKALAELARRDSAARLSYVRLLLEVGKYSEAAAAAQAGGDPRLAAELSDALRRQGKYAEAESAVAGSPQMAAQFAYAELLARRGETARAAQLYREITQAPLQDGAWEAALVAARSRQRLEDFHGANGAFQDLLDRYPDSGPIRIAWGELFLEKYNAAEARGLYEEVLEKNPRHPQALLGVAQCIADGADPKGRQLLDQALETNPNLVEVFQMRARQMIEEEQYEAAATELESAGKIDAENLETASLRAALAYFTRQDFQQHFARVAALNPHYGEGWFQLGELCASQKRFDDAVTFLRKAIEMDPRLWRAHAALGMNLLRLGEEQEGKQALERAYQGDPFHVWTVNTLRLLDSFKYYRDSQTAHFRLRLHAKEEMLRGLAEDLLEKSYQVLSQRYQFAPPFKTSVEFYPHHEDFAVRTLGIPGLGALGATFGKVVALDSPMARKRGEYNWASTLWHEVAHVFTLGLSEMKVPRWLTEGLSTYEENLVRPGWGRRIDAAFVDAAHKGRLLPLKELSVGFMRPKYPEQITVSYTQASLVCRYLVEQYGWDRLRQLLRLFVEKREDEAFQSVYGKSLERLDGEFQAYLKPLVARVAAQLDKTSPTEYMQEVRRGEDYFKRGDWPKAAEAYRRAIALEPEPRLPINVFFWLGLAEERMGNPEAAMNAFLKAGQLFETEEEAYRRALDLALEHDRREVAAAAYEELMFLYPADPDLHLEMGEAWLRWNRPEEALAPLKRAALMEGADAARAHYLLGRAYWAAGKADLARKAVLAALDIAPSFEQAQQLLLEIAEGRR